MQLERDMLQCMTLLVANLQHPTGSMAITFVTGCRDWGFLTRHKTHLQVGSFTEPGLAGHMGTTTTGFWIEVF